MDFLLRNSSLVLVIGVALADAVTTYRAFKQLRKWLLVWNYALSWIPCLIFVIIAPGLESYLVYTVLGLLCWLLLSRLILGRRIRKLYLESGEISQSS